jgi:branched-chain amino acid transport system substrate-binding protein
MGKIKLADNIMPVVWWVGQWQKGEFVGLAPTSYEGAKSPLFPKPDWAK